MSKNKSKLDLVRELALAIPGVEESTIHGAPSWKFRGKLLACPAIHKSAEPDSLLVKIAPDDRTERLTLKPGTYYATDHYTSNSVVLVRLSKIDRRALESLLNRARLYLSGERKTAPAARKPDAKEPVGKKPSANARRPRKR
jgi:hypothetical protein